MKQIYSINTKFPRNATKAYITGVDNALIHNIHLFDTSLKVLPPEPQLSDIYHISEDQKRGTQLFVAIETEIIRFVDFKQTTEKKQNKVYNQQKLNNHYAQQQRVKKGCVIIYKKSMFSNSNTEK